MPRRHFKAELASVDAQLIPCLSQAKEQYEASMSELRGKLLVADEELRAARAKLTEGRKADGAYRRDRSNFEAAMENKTQELSIAHAEISELEGRLAEVKKTNSEKVATLLDRLGEQKQDLDLVQRRLHAAEATAAAATQAADASQAEVRQLHEAMRAATSAAQAAEMNRLEVKQARADIRQAKIDVCEARGAARWLLGALLRARKAAPAPPAPPEPPAARAGRTAAHRPHRPPRRRPHRPRSRRRRPPHRAHVAHAHHATHAAHAAVRGQSDQAPLDATHHARIRADRLLGGRTRNAVEFDRVGQWTQAHIAAFVEKAQTSGDAFVHSPTTQPALCL